MFPRLQALIADDDPDAAGSLVEHLVREGLACETAATGAAALNAVRRHACDFVICDVRSRDMGEFELLERIKMLQPTMPVIVGTSTGSIRQAVEAVKHGAFQYLEKPFSIPDILGFIAQATHESTRSDRTTGPPPARRVVGMPQGQLESTSPVMRKLVESIALVARSHAAVLLLGESGTGKERVARAIHDGGPRASQPFVAVNTSAIPEQLLESEVFGHVRGAFTGATHARRGLLPEADGGTLLLDEIGDMPVALQPKLLRVLQFGEIRPVGSDRIGHVDVRIIAATHRDLSILVREGHFREDLRYRLNVIPLLVPPLRQRREDIRPLAELFLEEARGRTIASPVRSISDEAMRALTQAVWPGNVRELENTIERLVVLGEEAEVTVKDLSFLDHLTTGEIWPGLDNSPWTLKQMNHRYLDWVLGQTDGDKARTARILNIDLSTLYRWERAKR